MEYRNSARAALWALALLVTAATVADAQVLYRRDPRQRPAELDIDGRLYKPAGHLKLWEFRIHPFLSEYLTYDDNIFLAPRHGNVEADGISRTTAGLRIDLPIDRHEVLAGYQVRVVEFLGRGAQDTLEHDAFVSAGLNFDWFYFDFNERIQKLTDPADLVNAVRVDRWKNTLIARAGIFTRPFLFELAYENRWFEFDDPLQSLDRLENYAKVTAFFLLREDSKAFQQVFAFLQYEFGHFHFRSAFHNDSHSSTIWAGAKGVLMEDFPFMVKIGYTAQTSSTSGTNTDHHDYEGMLWESRITYRFDGHYTLSMACYRHIEVSGSSNFQAYDRGELGFEMQFPPKLTENLYAGLHVFFDTANPSNAPIYSRVGFGAKVEYYVHDWTNIGLFYEHRYRYTNLPQADYRDNQLSLHITVFF